MYDEDFRWKGRWSSPPCARQLPPPGGRPPTPIGVDTSGAIAGELSRFLWFFFSHIPRRVWACAHTLTPSGLFIYWMRQARFLDSFFTDVPSLTSSGRQCRLVSPRKGGIILHLKCAIIIVFIFKYRPSRSGYNYNEDVLRHSPVISHIWRVCAAGCSAAAAVMDLRPFSKEQHGLLFLGVFLFKSLAVHSVDIITINLIGGGKLPSERWHRKQPDARNYPAATVARVAVRQPAAAVENVNRSQSERERERERNRERERSFEACQTASLCPFVWVVLFLLLGGHGANALENETMGHVCVFFSKSQILTSRSSCWHQGEDKVTPDLVGSPRCGIVLLFVVTEDNAQCRPCGRDTAHQKGKKLKKQWAEKRLEPWKSDRMARHDAE